METDGDPRSAHHHGYTRGWKEAMEMMTLVGIPPKTRRQLLLVARERQRQDAKHGADSAAHNGAERGLIILGEEYGEACQALLHDVYGGPAKGTLKDELVQVSAVAIAILEGLHAAGTR